jgi:hypothetical protein
MFDCAYISPSTTAAHFRKLTPLVLMETLLPAVRAQDLQRQLPGLTSGEGVAETSFGGYRPVVAAPAEQAQSSDGR